VLVIASWHAGGGKEDNGGAILRSVCRGLRRDEGKRKEGDWVDFPFQAAKQKEGTSSASKNPSEGAEGVRGFRGGGDRREESG